MPEQTVHYLEIVTPEAEAVRDLYAHTNGWEFETVPEFGNAFVASLPDGSRFGIRAPMHEQEKPVVRPYVRVANIDKAVARVIQSAGEIALEPTEIPGHGRIAIYCCGGIEHGLWQVP